MKQSKRIKIYTNKWHNDTIKLRRHLHQHIEHGRT